MTAAANTLERAIELDQAEALRVAECVLLALEPHCARVKIAGDLRRGAESVRSIELVCIPRRESIPALFDFDTADLIPVRGFADTVNGWERVKGEPSGHYTRRLVRGQFQTSPNCATVITAPVPVDLYMTGADSWGLILFQRTGPVDYVRQAFGRLKQLGYSCDHGTLRNPAGGPVPLPSEHDFFRALERDWIEPSKRKSE